MPYCWSEAPRTKIGGNTDQARVGSAFGKLVHDQVSRNDDRLPSETNIHWLMDSKVL
jgi:hypothetical protein